MYSITDASFLSEEFLNQYQGKRPLHAGVLFDVVYLRTYSRWRDDIQRRETWLETVQRVVEYSFSLYTGHYSSDALIIEAQNLFDDIFNLRVLPAGRTLWIGGTPSSYKFGESNFNCSFAVINSIESFTDLFHLLLCGCGVGFRILESDIKTLPKFGKVSIKHKDYFPVHEKLRFDRTTIDYEDNQHIIEIGDSREGWVDALRCFLNISASNAEAKIVLNYNRIRPEGSRIKTFGGKAPGPNGLREMFSNIGEIINSSTGTLTPVNVMDICNFIGKNVIIGGTRRSSQIALGSPDDSEFLNAKLDLWKTKTNLQRTMSNNSVVFTSKPNKEIIETIFKNIKNNGEPGFFNLGAARKRRPNVHGLNPCKPLKSLILTDQGYITFEQALKMESLKVVLKDGSIVNASKPFKTGTNRPVHRFLLSNGAYIYATGNHLHRAANGEWLEADKFYPGLELDYGIPKVLAYGPITNEEDYKQGILSGWIHGDGSLSERKDTKGYTTQLCFGYHELDVTNIFENMFNKSSVPHFQNPDTCKVITSHKVDIIKKLIDKGMSLNKEDLSWLYLQSRDFKLGFIKALFTADGLVRKNGLVELYSSRRMALDVVANILREFGVYCNITTHNKAKTYIAKDGKIRNNSTSFKITIYGGQFKQIGFISELKQELLNRHEFKAPYRPYKLKIKEIDWNYSIEDVYDITVDHPDHYFIDASSIAHNCAEILLDSQGFCNLCTINLHSFVKGTSDFKRKKLAGAIKRAVRLGLRATNITVSLPEWDKKQKRDRLLGVSLTGVMDAFDHLGWSYNSSEAIQLLCWMRDIANKEANRYAHEMRVPCPLLVTCVKPEGCWTKEYTRTFDQGILFLDEIYNDIEKHDGFHNLHVRKLATRYSSNGYGVTKTYTNHIKPIKKITLRNGRVLKITEEHPMFIRNIKNINGFGSWVKAKDLKPGMEIDSSLGSYTRIIEDRLLNSSLDGLRADTKDYPTPKALSPNLAWLIGLYWGDGCFTSNNRIKLIGAELDIHLKAQKIWKELFNVETTIKQCTDRKGWTQDFQSAKLRRWFFENGLDKESHTDLTKLPERVRRSSKESIIAFIAGLSDADGCFANKSFCIDNKSEFFMRHLQEVGEAVGLCFGLSINKQRLNSHSKKPIYKLHLSRTGSIKESMDLINKHSIKGNSKPIEFSQNSNKTFYPYSIKSIEEGEQEQTFDIEVSGVHWYYQGGLKSHNTLSQLPTVSSGLHRAYAPYYIRRIRISAMDPVAKALQKLGLSFEYDHGKKERLVFSFPIKTDAKLAANNESAIDQFNRYLTFQKFYTDHNSSCTLTIGENEWESIVNSVYSNWNDVIACAFLPKYTDAYPQMPYEEISKEKYEEMVEKFPNLKNLEDLVNEIEIQEYEDVELDSDCSSGVCPIR